MHELADLKDVSGNRVETVAVDANDSTGTSVDDNGTSNINPTIPAKFHGTSADDHEMRSMGRHQELNRNFHFISILGFACTLMSSWETTLTTITFGLLNGGPAGLVWGYVIVFAGMLTVFASVAEMASMAPTAAGQYHWVSEFAPPKFQKILSYAVGWICVLGWQTAATSVAFLAGTIIQGLLVLIYPNYIFEPYQGTLLCIAVASFSILFNSYLAKKLPLVEGFVLFVHIFGLLAITITLWTLAPRNTAAMVFTEFDNGGGWATTGVSVMVGLLTPVYALTGVDSAVHMSEETRDASIILPRAIIWSVIINGFAGLFMTITFCFTFGNAADILVSPTGFPFLQVFYNVTNSQVGTVLMASILIVNLTSCTISSIASASRQLWSFARDRGIPCANFVAYVKPGWNIPLNAVLISLAFTVLLSLINIGSTVAFNAIAALAVAALTSSYQISLACLIAKRLRGDTLPARRWSLGRYGIYVNCVALGFLFVVWFFSFWPESAVVTPVTMNWNVVMYGGVVIFATVYYVLIGRHYYNGPVALLKREL
ncbi:hypothetical protein MMC15_007980 [Xylographa vitiligo]|nr:hypothetical protein [Xylographa vitiligo]